MRTCLHILLLILLVSSPALNKCCAQDIRLSDKITIDPIKEKIRNAVKDRSVVLLGEPTHGEGNVISYKTEIVRYLHDSLNFNIIAFESGIYDLYYAQELIRKNPTTSSNLFLNNSLFPIWTSAEQFQLLLNYIEASKSKLIVAGFDCQLSGKYSELYLTDSIQAFISRYHPTATINKDILAEVVSYFSDNYSFPDDVDHTKFLTAINYVIRNLGEIAGDRHLTTNEATLCAVYLQAARNLKGLAFDYIQKKGKLLDATTFKASDSNIRDSLMAESLLTLMRIYPGQKIICWGGGTHFINDTRAIANKELRPYRSMGMRLKTTLGAEKVLNITFISPGGSYGLVNEEKKRVPAPLQNSLEQKLSADSSVRYIDLHSTEYENRRFISSALEYQPLEADWSKVFDGFVYLRAYEPMKYVYANTTKDSAAVNPPIDAIAQDKTLSASLDIAAGRVIDAESKEPLSFATVHLRNNSAGTVCNNKGEFKLTQPLYPGDSLVITAIGYKSAIIRAVSPQVGVIALLRQSQTLDSATVTAKRPDALSIIKGAVAHYDLNYGQSAYSQYAYINSRNLNNSLVFTDADYTADVYYIDMATVPKASFREKNINRFDSALVEKIGIFNNLPYNVTNFDIIRNGLFLTGSRYRGYTYTLIKSYNDSLFGPIYILHFEANKKGAKFTGDFFAGSMAGELVIRKQDYAVISLNYQLVRKIDKIRKWAAKYYSQKSDKAAFWNKVPENEKVTFFCRYSKNEESGKYFLSYANEVFAEKGLLQNDKEPLDLISDLTFFDLGKISPIADPTKLPFSSFKRWVDAKYDHIFWENFKFPMLNRYDDHNSNK